MKFTTLAFLLALSTCNRSMHQKFDIEGHRGCRGLAPENTILAMKTAVDLGVTTLEMDVVVTADSQLVLSHEPFFNHAITTPPAGLEINEGNERSYNIYNMTYDSSKKFDVGIKPYSTFPEQKKVRAYKPLLADVIDTVERYCHEMNLEKKSYNIEIKSNEGTDDKYHPAPIAYAELLVKLLYKKAVANRTIIQSFDPRPLRYLAQKYPDLQLSLLIEDNEISIDSIEKEYGFRPSIVSPDFSLLNRETVAALHEHHFRVIPWTVNDLDKARELYRWGVDGIITDYPDRINIKSVTGRDVDYR